MRLFFRFFRFVIPYWKKYTLIMSLSTVSGLLTLINPYLTRWIVDDAIARKDFHLFILLGGAMAAVFCCETAVGAWRQLLERQVRLKLGFDLARKTMSKIVSLSPLQLKEECSSGHLYRVSYDGDRVKDFLATTIPDIAYIFPKLLLTIAILFVLNAKIACLVFFLPFFYIPSFWLNRKVKLFWDLLIKNYQEVFKTAAETFSNLEVVKAFGTEADAVRKYVRKYIQMIRTELRKSRWEIAAGIAMQVAAKAILAVAALWGGYQIIRGSLPLGVFASILVYLGQLAALKGKMANLFQNISLGLVSCERVRALLDMRPMVVEFPQARPVILKNPNLVFDRVTFGYPAGEPVLRGLSFEFHAGSHIGLVGPSGCGKTTLVGLILRTVDPWEGKIFLSSVDLREFTFRSLKSQVAIALQEPLLWDDIIANNIRYGNQHASFEEVLWAARLAGVDTFAGDDLEGRQQKLGEKACKLSEGQKQRIAIARALIRRPKVLILDEAMSSIDSASEMKIIEAIRSQDPSLLIVSVSHRLSTVMKADLVYYLKRPDLITSGPPREMIQTDPDFARLFAGQIFEIQHIG